MKATLSKSKIRAINNQVSSNLGNETVILHIQKGSYYGLNEVGTRIWNLIQESTSFETIKDVILSEYNVEESQLESDLNVIFNDLLKKGLIEIETNDEATS